MKIGIGTVQFGLDYGISNKGGRTPKEEVREILDLARKKGVVYLDTASQYGESESVLGAVLGENNPFRIVTKSVALRKTQIQADDVNLVRQKFMESLSKCRVNFFYGLLFHEANDLLAEGGERLWELFTEFRDQGLVRKIGVSIYTGAQLDAIAKKFPIELVQAPVNVFDQRLLISGQLQRLKSRDVEIHARSVFLQGLLLMNPEEVPENLKSAVPALRAFQKAAAEGGMSPMQAALNFANSLDEVDVIICGVNNAAQLAEICDASAMKGKRLDYSAFAINDEKILNPANWALGGK